LFTFWAINGINDNKLSSSPTHAEIQFVDEIAMKVPEISISENTTLSKI